MAIHAVFPERYEQQLSEKLTLLREDFADFTLPEIEVFRSPTEHYRQRAEFKMWQEGGQAYYAMYKPGEYKKPFKIDSFPVGAKRINDLMPPLLETINASEVLRKRLFQVEFLTTLSGEVLITLIYHKPLDDEWRQQAEQLKASLGIDIIGRSRKQKLVLDRDFVMETLTVDGKQYRYQQVESSFTQPNAEVCQHMLSWALDSAAPLSGDLLELYCGNGNFTVPLAGHFDKVLATEISKTSVKSAQYNFDINQVENVSIARMSSEEFSEAMDGVRAFRRLKDIDLGSYQFSTVLVDPPRAGLDEHTTEIVKGFDNILYISCNPQTLKHNLKSITQSHDIERFAIFDQFPYTNHLECGVLLSRRG